MPNSSVLDSKKIEEFKLANQVMGQSRTINAQKANSRAKLFMNWAKLISANTTRR